MLASALAGEVLSDSVLLVSALALEGLSDCVLLVAVGAEAVVSVAGGDRLLRSSLGAALAVRGNGIEVVACAHYVRPWQVVSLPRAPRIVTHTIGIEMHSKKMKTSSKTAAECHKQLVF